MKKIIIIGYGIHGISQLTLEAFDYIRSSELTCILGPLIHYNALKEMNVNNINLINKLYENDKADIDNYTNIANYIIQQLDQYQNVTFLVPGHPRVGVTLTYLLEKKGKENNFECLVLPGISSFDTMINDLKCDPLERGSVILDVNRLLLFNHSMDNKLNYFLYHICSIGNKKTNFKNPQKDNKTHLLKQHLLKFYKNNDPIYLLQSSTSQEKDSIITTGTVELIEGLLEKVNFDCSLFIPGKIDKEHINQEFYEVIKNDFIQ